MGKFKERTHGPNYELFEQMACAPGVLLTDDGREVLWVDGVSYVMRHEVHASRLAEALTRAKQRDAAVTAQKVVVSTGATCASLIDGQLCGGTLLRAAVCPRCALGKQGVAATLTCDVCGHVTAIMRGEA